MTQREIDIKLDASTIQNLNGAKLWARDHEIRMDRRVDGLRDEIAELRDVDDEQQKGINRNLKFVVISIIVFGSAFAVVVVLFGIPQIIERLFGGAP